VRATRARRPSKRPARPPGRRNGRPRRRFTAAISARPPQAARRGRSRRRGRWLRPSGRRMSRGR
jgi:hypothetical protein